MPERFCNFGRLLEVMERENLDGLVLNGRHNVYYTTGFWLTGLHADEPYPCAFVFSRHAPDEPIVVTPDITLGVFLQQETWVRDIRPYRLLQVAQMDIPLEHQDLDRYLPEGGEAAPWYANARRTYASHTNIATGCTAALGDLGLTEGTIGTDNPRLVPAIDSTGAHAVDAYWLMMDVRHVKTELEIELLKDATRVNQRAQERMVREWQLGMTWREAYDVYNEEVRNLGGHTCTPDVAAISPLADVFMANSPSELDSPLEPQTNVMLDCHGVLSGYCWDGGKTWRVGEPAPEGQARKRMSAATQALREVAAACKPRARTSDLQAIGREVLRKNGLSEADDALIFFHGLGLSHVDMNMVEEDASAQEGAMLATHVYVPGGPTERIYLEDIVLVTGDGGESIFDWDFVDW